MGALLIAIALAVLLGLLLALVAARKTVERPQPRPRYSLLPFPGYGDVFTLAEYKELLKLYSMDDGSGYWASSAGYWHDNELNSRIRVNPYGIRAGELPPEPIFTHIMYFAK